MNTTSAKVCNSCGSPINVGDTTNSKRLPRPRAATPRRFQSRTPAPAPRRQPDLAALPFGSRLVARETFTFKTQAGRVEKVTAGVTYLSKDSEAYKAKPSAFQYAA
jgi:hypothetical protein